jgi:hypothetical protein
MRKGIILSSAMLLLAAVIPLAAQAQDAGVTAAPAPKPKAKHVYTDADLRPLDEKCADPSVPAEDKTSCPKAPAADKDKDKAATPAKAKKEVPIYDEYGSKLPVEPDVTKMGSDGLKERIRGMQVQMDRSHESIDMWTKRQAAAKTDEEKASLQKLIDTSKEQLRIYTERKKDAEAQLATIKE